MNTQAINHIFNQISFKQVKNTLLFLIITSVVLYVSLVISSTATLSNINTMKKQARQTQEEITEINGLIASKNQELARKLKDDSKYVSPVLMTYININEVQPSLALER